MAQLSTHLSHFRPLRARITRWLTPFFDELRWTFSWPMVWFQSVLINLALAAFYLIFKQPTISGHYDTVLLYCVYFSTFILADVTTTNIFGVDLVRTTTALDNHQSFLRILLRKNAVQFTIIFVPVLLVTAAWTEYLYQDSELLRTIPGVLYPMLLFVAIGNLISVLFPVVQAPLSWHIRHWKKWRYHVALLTSYAIPFMIFAVWALTDLPTVLFQMLRDGGSDSFVPPGEIATLLVIVSYAIYWVVTLIATMIFHRRGFVFLAQKTLLKEGPFDPSERKAIARWHNEILSASHASPGLEAP